MLFLLFDIIKAVVVHGILLSGKVSEYYIAEGFGCESGVLGQIVIDAEYEYRCDCSREKIEKAFREDCAEWEKLAENISDLKSEIQNTESEIESINDKLDTCRDRMAELLALPSLSFVEQEELSNLEKEIALLERKLALEEALLARQETQLVSDTEEYIEEAWNDQGAYYIDNKGKIKKDSGWSGFWHDSEDTTTVLNKAMTRYRKNDEDIAILEDMTLNWDKWDKSKRLKAIQGLNNGLSFENYFDPTDDVSDIEKVIENYKQDNIDIL